MSTTPGWSETLVSYIFRHRYIMIIIVILSVIGFGYYLHEERKWKGKDVMQICTGLLILLTLFFAALNYEFTSSKARRDYAAARNLLTFNTACEWHKKPLSDYQKESIKFEVIFTSGSSDKKIDDFNKFINEPDKFEFKETLKGIINHFECVSIGVSNDLIDKEFIKTFYRTIFRIYYIDYLPYIESERSRMKSDTIWKEFTTLVENWEPNLLNEIRNGDVVSTIIKS